MSVTSIPANERTESNMDYISELVSIMRAEESSLDTKEKARLELLSFGYFTDIEG